MRRALHIREIKTEDVVVLMPGVVQRLHALCVQARVEVPLIGFKSGSEPHQSGGKKSSTKNGRSQSQRLPGNFPSKASHLLSGSAAHQGVRAGVELCMVGLLHAIHAPVSFSEQGLHVISVVRTEGS